MNKQDFIRKFNEVIDGNYSKMAVEISHPDLPSTDIINDNRECFYASLAYYKEAYDDDMRLKTCDTAEIINVYGVK